MEDSEILELYFSRDERAVEETQSKYGKYSRYIARQILFDTEEAEETENDVYLKAWNTIPPNRPESLKSYVGMLSRQLALDKYEKSHAKKRGGEVALLLDELSECVSVGESKEDMGESLALREALNKFLRSLPEKTRIIFLRRYWYAIPLAQIAKEFNEKESSVGVLMLRTRKKMKKFLKEEGFDL